MSPDLIKSQRGNICDFRLLIPRSGGILKPERSFELLAIIPRGYGRPNKDTNIGVVLGSQIRRGQVVKCGGCPNFF